MGSASVGSRLICNSSHGLPLDKKGKGVGGIRRGLAEGTLVWRPRSDAAPAAPPAAIVSSQGIKMEEAGMLPGGC